MVNLPRNEVVSGTVFSRLPSNHIKSVNEPVDAPTTIDHHSIVNTSFIAQRNMGSPEPRVVAVDSPARTLTSTAGNQDLVRCKPFVLNKNFNNVGKSIDEPGPTLVSSRRHPYLLTPVPF